VSMAVCIYSFPRSPPVPEGVGALRRDSTAARPPAKVRSFLASRGLRWGFELYDDSVLADVQ